jgi:hypothetical protein
MIDYIDDIKKTINNFQKNLIKSKKLIAVFSVIAILIIFVIGVITFLNIKSFSIEVKEAKVQFENGIRKIQDGLYAIEEEFDEGDKIITLKEDAFSVVDTEIDFEDGLQNIEIEKGLNEQKHGFEAIEDGFLEDSKKNGKKLDEIWGIEQELSDFNFDYNFNYRFSHTHKQHLYRLNIKYFNQRNIKRIGHIICVPSSATILLSGLGYNIDVKSLINFFKSDVVIEYAKTHCGTWIEKYIKENKLYQITGIFCFGLNEYMKKHYPEFPYKLDYNYWDLKQIIDYLENYGLMSATYLPSWVLRQERKGGHMIVITKVYRDYNGNVIGLGINDPFGNPNAHYSGKLGRDGHNVIISLDTMLKCMKSYNDDHDKGVNYLYRVLYLKDRE